MDRKRRKKSRGQSTIEYVLMLAFGALFAIQIVKFFNGVFQEGLLGLEQNIGLEVSSGEGFSQ